MKLLFLVMLTVAASQDELQSVEEGTILRELRNDLTRMQSLIDQQQAMIRAQNHKIAAFQGSTDKKISNVHARVADIEKLQRKQNNSLSSSAVGFTAYSSTPRTYRNRDTILFDAMATDLGGHYDPASSVFTCPYTGVYMFSLNLMTATMGERAKGGIYLEGELLVATVAEYVTSDRAHNPHASTFSIAECHTGHTVYVRADDDSDLQGDSNRFSSFSGYLLSRTDLTPN